MLPPADGDLTSGLGRLANAYRAVLGTAFEEQFRALASARQWYHDGLPVSEVFRLWVCDNLEVPTETGWVFEPIRASERPLLCDALEIPRSAMHGSTPKRLAHRVLDASGIPLNYGRDLKSELSLWRDLLSRIQAGEDERASVQLRSCAERLLKKILHFHCATSIGTVALDILRNPGTLRVPKAVASLLVLEDGQALEKLVHLFVSEGGLDLGFLILLLRKIDDYLGDTRTSTSGSENALFSVPDQRAFDLLATALQSYAHDKPSKIGDRRSELTAAADQVLERVESMVARRVVPDEGLVRERGESLYGGFFRVQGSFRASVIAANKLPELGQRVLFIGSSARDYSAGVWVASPWPTDSL